MRAAKSIKNYSLVILPLLLFSVLSSSLLLVSDQFLPLFWFPAGVLAILFHFYHDEWKSIAGWYLVLHIIAHAHHIISDEASNVVIGAIIVILTAVVEIFTVKFFLFLVYRWMGKDVKLIYSSQVLKLFACSIIASLFISFNAPLMAFYFDWDFNTAVTAVIQWQPTEILSFLILYPIALHIEEFKKLGKRRLLLDSSIVLLYSLPIMYVTFSPQYIGSPIQSVPFLLYPPFLYAMFRLGTAGFSIIFCLLIATALIGASLGAGPFSKQGEFAIIVTQIFAIIIGITMLLVSAVINQQRHNRRLLKSMNQVLEDKVEKRTEALRKEVNEKAIIARRLEMMANTDLLTNLPNRNYLYKKLKEKLAEEAPFGVLFCDLDRFKNINDSYGHMTGDELLVEITFRLRQILGTDDFATRWGGDEFVILTSGNQQRAYLVAEKIASMFAQKFVVQERELYSGISIGVSLFPEDASEPDSLLKLADSALNKAKDEGRNQIWFSQEVENESARHFLKMEIELRKAIKQNEFVVFYQPKYSLETGLLTGHEALIRWQKDDGTLVPPNLFIPAAEELGLISTMGEFVMFEACKQTQLWRESKSELYGALNIAVNVSTRQIKFGSLLGVVQKALSESGLPPELLEIEITETAIMTATQEQIQLLAELKNLGVKVALDDFGTGYSSLSYLTRFPIDVIKIDRSFISDMKHNNDSYALVESIIGLAKRLGKKVVAEGIEEFYQMELLKGLGCELGQGYLMGKPQPPSELSLQSMEVSVRANPSV